MLRKLLKPACTQIVGTGGGKKAVCLGHLLRKPLTDPLQETGAFPTAFCAHGEVFEAGLRKWPLWENTRRCPLYWTELAPADSKINSLLPKAKPISDTGGTLSIAYLTKGKLHCTAPVEDRNKKKSKRNISLDTKVTEKKGGGGAAGTGADLVLCSPWCRPW